MDNILFLSLLVIFATTLQVSTSKKTCACGLSTEGVNACGCEQLVVRPPKVNKIHPAESRIICKKVPGVPKLGPIGDACSCGSINVSPAGGQKQPCPLHDVHKEQNIYNNEHSSLVNLESQAQNYRPGWQGTFYSDKHHQFEQQAFSGQQQGHSTSLCTEEKLSALSQQSLADAVSLSLAYGLAKNAANSAREDGLLYGPKGIPKDGFAKKAIINVPEERLHSIDKQVMKLRVRPTSDFSCDHKAAQLEAEDALVEAQEKELLEMQHHRHGFSSISHNLNYHDLGYVPETTKQLKLKTGSSIRYAENAFAERHLTGFSGEESTSVFDDDTCTQSHQMGQQAQAVGEDSDDYTNEETDCKEDFPEVSHSHNAQYSGHRQIMLQKLGF